MPDPWRRYAERWIENGQWTSRVRTGSVESSDPVPAGEGYAPLPDATMSASPKSVPKWAWAVGAAVVALVVVAAVAGSGTSANDGGSGSRPDASVVSTTSTPTSAPTTTAAPTTTVDVAAINSRANLAVNQACLAQSPAGFVTDALAGYDDEFAQAGVDQGAYSALLTACVAKNLQASIDAAAPVTVDEIIKNPDAVKGQSFLLVAEITQFDAATGACAFRGYWDREPHEYSFDYAGDNAVFASGDAETNCPALNGVDQNDVVRLWVRSLGSLTYDTQIGGSTTVPSFQVLRAQVIEKK